MPAYLNTRYCQILFMGFSILLFGSLPAQAGEAFRICADPKNPPFSTRSETGFENQIASLFARKLEQATDYTWFPQRLGFIRNTLKAKLPNKNQYKCDVVLGVPTGYNLTLTTDSYYHSVYGMIYPKDRGLDDIKSPSDLALLPPDRKQKLKIAMFDRGPGTAWIVKNGLVEQGVPYQSMTGDIDNTTATTMDRDFKAGVIDLAILWGPMAGYVISNSAPGTYAFLPMHSVAGMKFDFPMSMGVRYGDKERKALLNELISENSDQIRQILKQHNVPLVEPDGRILFIPGN